MATLTPESTKDKSVELPADVMALLTLLDVVKALPKVVDDSAGEDQSSSESDDDEGDSEDENDSDKSASHNQEIVLQLTQLLEAVCLTAGIENCMIVQQVVLPDLVLYSWSMSPCCYTTTKQATNNAINTGENLQGVSKFLKKNPGIVQFPTQKTKSGEPGKAYTKWNKGSVITLVQEHEAKKLEEEAKKKPGTSGNRKVFRLCTILTLSALSLPYQTL
jgi:hypothetical protein